MTTTLIRTPAFEKVEAIEAGVPRTDPDADLVEMLRGGRSEAAEALVTRFGRRAYRLAVRITGNAHDAEEVTQDALWRVLHKIHTFRGESAFSSWVCRIAANSAYETLRRHHHERHEVSWEESLPSFDDLGGMLRPSRTRRHASMTRPSRANCVPSSRGRSSTFRRSIGPSSSCATWTGRRTPRWQRRWG